MTSVGKASARIATRSARCIPNVAFQPDESVTWTGAIGVPSWRKYRELVPTLAPHFSMAAPSPILSRWRTLLGVRNTPAPISPRTGACSYTDTGTPRAMSALAANSPPMPPPTMMAVGGLRIITSQQRPRQNTPVVLLYLHTD